MTELELARAIVAGTEQSPHKCGNAWLVALRISGSGIADRPGHGETAYRPPEIWTSPEMVQRAAGLPVVLGHPDGGVLTPEEYADRSIGSVILPYVNGGELCGVARLLIDDEAAAALASGGFSTSPAVSFKPGESTAMQGHDGVLLIERDPSLLDHVAIVTNNGDIGGGVWDRQGPGRGIRSDSKQERNMSEQETEAGKSAKEQAERMDDVLKSLSAIADMCTSMGKRLDTIESRAKADDVLDEMPRQGEEEPGVKKPVEGVSADKRRRDGYYDDMPEKAIYSPGATEFPRRMALRPRRRWRAKAPMLTVFDCCGHISSIRPPCRTSI